MNQIPYNSRNQLDAVRHAICSVGLHSHHHASGSRAVEFDLIEMLTGTDGGCERCSPRTAVDLGDPAPQQQLHWHAPGRSGHEGGLIVLPCAEEHNPKVRACSENDLTQKPLSIAVYCSLHITLPTLHATSGKSMILAPFVAPSGVHPPIFLDSSGLDSPCLPGKGWAWSGLDWQ